MGAVPDRNEDTERPPENKRSNPIRLLMLIFVI